MEQLINGLAVALTPAALAYIVAGTSVGILLGAMPGLGPTMGMAVALPFVVYIPPEHAVFLLVSMIVGANFGNSIPAVLIRIPGTAAAVLTVEEGYPFQQRGEGGTALAVCLAASFIGQTLGVIVFAMFTIPIANFAVRFLFPEFFALALFGLLAAAALVGDNLRKGLAGVIIGLLLATIGTDPISGQPRLTFGVTRLLGGLPMLPALIGFLALREVFASLVTQMSGTGVARVDRSQVTTSFWRPPPFPLSRLREILGASSVGAAVGLTLGAMPGAGPAAATFVTYRATSSVRRWRKPPGVGSLPILGAIDSSQNAAGTAALIPTLALGIPGSVAMVIVMAALGAQGLVVGPQLEASRPGLLAAITGGLLVATFVMVVLGYFLIAPSVYATTLSAPAVVYVTLVMVVAGTFALRWSMFDVWVCIVTGFAGYLLNRFGVPVAPLVLALVLGRMVEANLRRGLVMTGGLVEFLTRPMTLGLLVTALAITAIDPVRSYLERRGGSDVERSEFEPEKTTIT